MLPAAALVAQEAADSGEIGNNTLLGVIIGLLTVTQIPQILLGWAQWRQQQAERAQTHTHSMETLRHDMRVQQDSTAMAMLEKLLARSSEQELEERTKTNRQIYDLTAAIGGFRQSHESLVTAVQDLQIQAAQLQQTMAVRAATRDPDSGTGGSRSPLPARPAPAEPTEEREA